MPRGGLRSARSRPGIGCAVEPSRSWDRQAERDRGEQSGTITEERKVGELRQAKEVLREASAYFAHAEPDRRLKP